MKSLRDGRAQISEAYVIIKNGDALLLNAHFTPLTSASTHITAEPARTRKLLLHRREIDKLAGKILAQDIGAGSTLRVSASKSRIYIKKT